MISEKDVQTYQRDGVIVVPEVLGADTLAQVRSVIAELVAGSAKTLEHTDVYDLEPGHTAESPRVRRIKAPHKVHPLFDDIVRSAPVLEILKKLLGPGLRLHGSKLNMKSAQYGSPVEWHQDWAFYPHTNDDILAIGVLLDDCDLANGPMLVTPGTHNRRGLESSRRGRLLRRPDRSRRHPGRDRARGALHGPRRQHVVPPRARAARLGASTPRTGRATCCSTKSPPATPGR